MKYCLSNKAKKNVFFFPNNFNQDKKTELLSTHNLELAQSCMMWLDVIPARVMVYP